MKNADISTVYKVLFNGGIRFWIEYTLKLTVSGAMLWFKKHAHIW